MKDIIYLSLIIIFFSCSNNNTKQQTDEPSNQTATNINVEEETSGTIYIKDGYKFTVNEIDSIQFTEKSIISVNKQKNPKVRRIEDIDSIKNILCNIVEFNEETSITKIHPRNGQTLDLSSEDGYSDFYIVAYLPEYDFLLMEGGHASELGFDLTSGESIFEVGQPENIDTSPNGKYRLSYIWSGQECNIFFIQEKQDKKYKTIVNLEDILSVCEMYKTYWENDTTFYFSTKVYEVDSEELKMRYYKLAFNKIN